MAMHSSYCCSPLPSPAGKIVITTPPARVQQRLRHGKQLALETQSGAALSFHKYLRWQGLGHLGGKTPQTVSQSNAAL